MPTERHQAWTDLDPDQRSKRADPVQEDNRWAGAAEGSRKRVGAYQDKASSIAATQADPDTNNRVHAWPLALPALAAWASALVFLACPPLAGTIVAAFATLGAAVTAWLTRSTSSPAPPRDTSTAPKNQREPGQAGWRNVLLATLICTAAASASAALRVHTLTTSPAAELAGQNAFITAEITLTNDPERRSTRTARFAQESYVVSADLKVIRTSITRQAVNIPITVFATGQAWSSLLPTQTVEVAGRLASPTPGTLVAATLLARTPPRVLTPPSTVQTAAGALRAGLRAAADVLPPDQRGLLPGLVVGDVSRMDPQVTADLREAGLSHLNAVSGANLAIVAGATLALSRLIGLSLPMRALFAAVAMLAFTVVARPSPSVLRALLMGLAAAIAMGTGRSKDGLAALSATVLFLVLFTPELARSYGFALSVTATAGILVLAPRWRDKLSGTKEENTPPDEPNRAPGEKRYTSPDEPDRPPGRKEFTSPDEPDGTPGRDESTSPDEPDRPPHRDESTPSKESNRIPDPISPRANLRKPPYRLPRFLAEAVAVPAAAQLAVTPVLVLMSGQLTPIAVIANIFVAPAVAPATLLGFGAALVAPVWPDGARLLVIPAGYAVGWIVTVARWAVNLPFATLPWPAGLPGLGLLLLAAIASIPVLRRRAWRTIALTAAVAALVAVLVIRPITAPWPPKGWLMVMCDVGQGDGLVLAAGQGRGVVVDTGPDPVTMDRCLRRLGIDDVLLIVLTHPHADHTDGLPGVLRNRRVGAVLVSPQRTGAHSSARISALLARGRIPEWTTPPGTRWRFGPSEVTVLAPDPSHAEMSGAGEGSAINNASVVLHVRWRAGSILLSGDLETEAQEELLHRLSIRADLLKTPHHGSNRQSPAFLASLGARAALISVGAHNDYGHPAMSTLGLLHRLGLAVYRTDQSGDLAVVEGEDGRGLAVVPRGP
ncbi:ComEC/Rec2 family competence protein [Nonomuraea sp. PA05]|uniref:ComEC/Rec2 family competence protein n=1 Tax=Nonomuraea sp. PA05 TaxID=2604466 RepID=UPI0016522290|nr:ComEC/Rec2 family competence protein [Nonomuraea sp. PA05]